MGRGAVRSRRRCGRFFGRTGRVAAAHARGGHAAAQDGDGSDTETSGAEGSAAVERVLLDFVRSEGLEALPTGLEVESDHAGCMERHIPVGGLFTGDTGRKGMAEVRRFGGEAEERYDFCYHRARVTLENVDVAALEETTEALVHTALILGGFEGALANGEAEEEDCSC
jgi:aminopeptidase S